MSLEEAVNIDLVNALLTALVPAFFTGILLGVALTLFGARNVESQARL